MNKKIIAVTGKQGSGKSTFCNMLASEINADVFNFDIFSHKVLLLENVKEIIIIAIIMALVMPSATRVSQNNKKRIYEEYENMMIEYAKVLSKGFPHVRVDLYAPDDHVYFSEMTFTSTQGRINWCTLEFLRFMGEKVKEGMK